jgi:hypothetical protein
MPTKCDKIKVPDIIYAFRSTSLTNLVTVWIGSWVKFIFQFNQANTAKRQKNKHRTNTRNQTNTTRRRKIKQRHTETTTSQKKILIYVKTVYGDVSSERDFYCERWEGWLTTIRLKSTAENKWVIKISRAPYSHNLYSLKCPLCTFTFQFPFFFLFIFCFWSLMFQFQNNTDCQKIFSNNTFHYYLINGNFWKVIKSNWFTNNY